MLGISGLYDLEPIKLCYLNEKLSLTSSEVAAHSPQLRIGHGVPTLLTVGGAELPELKRQTADYVSHLRGAEEPVKAIPSPDHNHFTILETLAHPEGAALEAVLHAFA